MRTYINVLHSHAWSECCWVIDPQAPGYAGLLWHRHDFRFQKHDRSVLYVIWVRGAVWSVWRGDEYGEDECLLMCVVDAGLHVFCLWDVDAERTTHVEYACARVCRRCCKRLTRYSENTEGTNWYCQASYSHPSKSSTPYRLSFAHPRIHYASRRMLFTVPARIWLTLFRYSLSPYPCTHHALMVSHFLCENCLSSLLGDQCTTLSLHGKMKFFDGLTCNSHICARTPERRPNSRRLPG